MSYSTFLLVFILPPILLLASIQRRPFAGIGGIRSRITLPLICLIAFIYTTPWDNYLVYRGVWSYGTGRVLGVIGYVPLEEYAFFLLQPILTGLFLYTLLSRTPADTYEVSSLATDNREIRLWGVCFFLAITALGALLLGSRSAHSLYLGLITAWAGPVLMGLWGYAGHYLWHLRKVIAAAVAWPTIYLWIADWVALRLGIWAISDAYSLGVDPFGLPIEEAVFFLFTNLLVVFGAILFLFGDRIAFHRREPQPY